MNLFVMGGSSLFAPRVLRLFWEDQGDAEWRLAAQVAGLDWSTYIQFKLTAARSPELVGPSGGMRHATRETMDVLRDMGRNRSMRLLTGTWLVQRPLWRSEGKGLRRCWRRVLVMRGSICSSARWRVGSAILTEGSRSAERGGARGRMGVAAC